MNKKYWNPLPVQSNKYVTIIDFIILQVYLHTMHQYQK